MLIANQGPQEVQEPIVDSVIIFKRDKTEQKTRLKTLKLPVWCLLQPLIEPFPPMWLFEIYPIFP